MTLIIARRSLQKLFITNSTRMYSDAFSKKEKAAEDQYVRKHEMEQLKKLREQLEKTKKEMDELESKLKETKN